MRRGPVMPEPGSPLWHGSERSDAGGCGSCRGEAATNKSPDAVEALVFEQRQGGSGVREVQALVCLPARAPGADVDARAFQEIEEVGAVGVPLADKRHVVQQIGRA